MADGAVTGGGLIKEFAYFHILVLAYSWVGTCPSFTVLTFHHLLSKYVNYVDKRYGWMR